MRVDYGGLTKTASQAIVAASDRLERARAADDVEGIVGAAKDLSETVAKVVLDALGGSYGSNTPLPKLAATAISTLAVHTDRPAMQRLSAAIISSAAAIAELRNSDGTGHGRSKRSTLSMEDAAFAGAATELWCSWLLGLVERRLEDTQRYDRALADIGGDEVFSKGALKTYLDGVGLEKAPETVQRKLGLAVARRWTINSTFMPLIDVIHPLAEGSTDFPVRFQDGLIEGLLLDADGRMRMTTRDVADSVGIAMRLRPHDRREILATLADHLDEAAPAPTFDLSSQNEVAALFHELAAENRPRDPDGALSRIARRLDAVVPTQG